jgi:predicted SnoaL-like aldol condensation-catalyzing enzyme
VAIQGEIIHMRLRKAKLFVSALVLTATVLTAASINPPTAPQTVPMTAQEKKNVDFVLNWWREVIYAGHLELTPKYQAEDYIQHNPSVPTGRAEFVEFFKKFSKPMNPIPAKMEHPPVVAGAKGDFVRLIFEQEKKHPHDASKTYYDNSLEVLRIQNGKVQEHWDSQMKMPGSGKVVTGVSPKPPMQWNTGKLSQEEEQTLALAKSEFKDMLQYAHLELADQTMDPGYIQHNATFPQGRDAFKQLMSQRPGRRPQDAKPIKEEWIDPPVLTLVNGPYCLLMMERTAKDPDDPTREYKWNHFNVIRVEKGLIKEHWDDFIIN